MKKRILAAVLAAAMVLGLAACGGSSSSTAPSSSAGQEAAGETKGDDAGENAASEAKVGETVFRCAFNQSAENPEAETLRRLSDALYDATEGRYSIEVYPNETLGSQAETFELLTTGVLEMTLVSTSIVENANSDFAIIGCPFIYDSEEHQQRVFEGDGLDALFATTEDLGFVTLAGYSLGPRCLYTPELIDTPEKLQNKKIRVMQSQTMIDMMKAMGAEGVAMGQADVYSAIQQGTIDGAENNIITYVDLLQYEVAPYYTLTKHLMIPDLLLVSKEYWDMMSAEDQAAFRKVAKESVTTGFNLCAELRTKYFEKAENELGVTVTEVDIAPYQEKCTDLINSIANRSDMTKQVYDAIQAAK